MALDVRWADNVGWVERGEPHQKGFGSWWGSPRSTHPTPATSDHAKAYSAPSCLHFFRSAAAGLVVAEDFVAIGAPVEVVRVVGIELDRLVEVL